jgi:hypothetical protein
VSWRAERRPPSRGFPTVTAGAERVGAVGGTVRTPRARGLPAVTATLLTLALAGCDFGGGSDRPDGSPAERTNPPGARPEAELEALLTRRAKALEAGDVRRYAATATGAQRAEDREDARSARGLPLRDVRLSAGKIAVEGRRAVLRVRSGYALRGIRGRFEADRTLRAVQGAEGWRIRSEASRRQRHPWEVARFGTQRTRHFLVLAPKALATDGLEDALEAGYERMGQILAKGRLRQRYLVVVAADARQARRMTAGIRGVATLAAISDTAVREEGPAERVARVASLRLLVLWPSFAVLEPEGRQRVIAHELTHAALAGITSGRTPSWLVEGIALYVSGDLRIDSAAQLVAAQALGEGASARAARRALTLTGLSRPDAIARLGGEGQTAAYAYSSAAAFYIVDRYGRKRFFDLYDRFNEESLAGKAGAELTDRAVRRALGIGLVRLERDLRRWIVTRGLDD